MSAYDWTAAIAIVFDLPILNTPSNTGWLIQSYEPNCSPEGELVLTTHPVKRIYKSEDNLTLTILLTIAGRMRYPIGDVTITFTGTLIGPDASFVAPFVRTFTPTGIVPIFNPNDPEYIELVEGTALAESHTMNYLFAQAAIEYIELTDATAVAVRYHIDDIPE